MSPESVTQRVEMFKERYPGVEVEVLLIDASNYAQSLEPYIAAGEMPDVVFVNCNSYFDSLADQGLLLDISDTYAWDRQLEFVKEGLRSPNGVGYGISSGVSTLVLFYNVDHFEAAGIEELPTCWEEFIDCCAKLKAAGFDPLAVAGAGPNNLGHSFVGFGIANEVYASGHDRDWVSNNLNGEYDFDTPEWKKVMERAAYLRDNDYFHDGFESADLYEALRVLSAGEATMSIQQASQAGNIFINDDVNLSCMPVPWQYSGDERVAITWPSDGVGLGKNSNNDKNLEIAKLFLEFYAYETAYIYQNATGGLNQFKDVSDMPNMIVDPRVQAAYEVNAATELQSTLPVQGFNSVTYGQVQVFAQEVVLGIAEPDMIAEYLNPAQAEYAASLG